LEGRELDAERLYEQAIRSARANGFIHMRRSPMNSLPALTRPVAFEKIAV